MARKKVREYSAKALLKKHLKELRGIELPTDAAQVAPLPANTPSPPQFKDPDAFVRFDTDYVKLLEANPWMKTTQLVVKPDMLFGKRGKHNLVGLNLDHEEVEVFVKGRLGKEIEVDGCLGQVDTFIIEPFVPHKEEFYFAIQSTRLGNTLLFSEAGGVEVEDNWEHIKQMAVGTLENIDAVDIGYLTSGIAPELRERMHAFIRGVFVVFEELDFSYMEFNPLTVDAVGNPIPLDMRGELDDTASFKNAKKWGELEFPMAFGKSMTVHEGAVRDMDECTGASLKLTILNPQGRVWSLVAGGGASVIYADTVGDLGLAHELGNYGEYSGAPNTNETYHYTKIVLQCATANPDGRGRALLIGGGIANFTDVAVTFTGIIRAIREMRDQIQASKMKLFVRRGGPNYQGGLAAMRALGGELGLDVEVFGPEASMTGICSLAIDYVTSFDSNPLKSKGSRDGCFAWSG